MTRQRTPYGTWSSPVTTDAVLASQIRISLPRLVDGALMWSELRPAEGGRSVLVRQRADGEVEDLIAAPWNARTRVHEYGGGAYAVAGDGAVIFSHFPDQRLYRIDGAGGEPEALTEAEGLRYADGVVDDARGRWIGVCEDHRGDGEAVARVVSASLSGVSEPEVLVEGSDFYASPRLSPCGGWLAWVSWEHPNMPWDATRLWLAPVDEGGALGEATCVAGGPGVSVQQPRWSPGGVLHYLSDRSGWWTLHRHTEAGEEALHAHERDFGRPPWLFGGRDYDFISEQEVLCSWSEQGVWRLARLDAASGALTTLELPWSPAGGVQVRGDRAVLLGYSATASKALLELDLSSGEVTVVRSSGAHGLDAEAISVAEPIAFPSKGGRTAHAFFYPPRNAHHEGPDDERPPLVVWSHGGPTGATSHGFNISTQYWTSRGFAVVDVNYGGSTGYGRAYRERLNGQWGVVDVEDCEAAARFLAEQGRVDGDRMAIAGGSAGGYTTLCALTFGDTFKAGASHFGVSDLMALARDTHKFESRYIDGLVGPLPEAAALYRERSPIHHVEGLSCPVIFFQGLEDQVVPPNQAELMVNALRERGLPVAYITYEGEQHGFRKAENIKRTLEAEIDFYARVFGFELADAIEPVPIENLT